MKRSIYSIILFSGFLVCFGLSLFPQNEDTQLLEKFIQIHNIQNIQVDSIDKSEEILRKIKKDFNPDNIKKYFKTDTAYFDSNKNLIGLIIILPKNRLNDLNLREFDNLEILVLNNCYIASVNSIQFPNSLKALDLSQNTLTAIDLKSLTNIKKLNLISCGLKTLHSSQLPPKLIHLNLKQNDLFSNKHEKKPGSTDLSGLRELYKLDLSDNDLSTIVSSQLPEKLIKLNLNFNPLKRDVNLSGLKKLELIKLMRCKLKNLRALKFPKSITDIDLSENESLTHINFNYLFNLKNLNLSGCGFIDLSVSQLPQSLTSLDLSSNSDLQSLNLRDPSNKPNSYTLNNLIKIDLTNCDLENLNQLELPISLRELILRDNDKLGDNDKDETLDLGYLSKLKILDLYKCGLDDSQLLNLKLPSSLSELDLSDNRLLTNFTLKNELESVNNLKITECKNLKKLELSKLPKLKILDLSNNKSLSIKIIEGLEKLKTINLTNCNIKKLCLMNLSVLSHLDLKTNEQLDIIDLRGESLLNLLELSHRGKILHLQPGQGKSTIENVKIKFIKKKLEDKKEERLTAIEIHDKGGGYRECLFKVDFNGEFAVVEISHDDKGIPSFIGKKARELTSRNLFKKMLDCLKKNIGLIFTIIIVILILFFFPQSKKIREFLNLTEWNSKFSSIIILIILYSKIVRYHLFKDHFEIFASPFFPKKEDIEKFKRNDFDVSALFTIEDDEKKGTNFNISDINSPITLKSNSKADKNIIFKYMIYQLSSRYKKIGKKNIPVFLKSDECTTGVIEAILNKLTEGFIKQKKIIQAMIKLNTMTVIIDADGSGDESTREIKNFIASFPQGSILICK